MPSEFSDRSILITGASGGLGRAVTRAFIETGAIVTGVYLRGAPPEGGLRFTALEADLTSPEDAARAVESVVRRVGRLDALIHLAGGFAGGRPVQETTDAVWKQMLDLNLNTAFYTIRAALPTMLAASRGRIVAVGSRTALEPAATLSAYGVSKAGLIALVRTLALELKGSGVTANAVLPSVIDTPANRAAMPGADHSRWVAPEAVARLILWLASDAAAAVSGAATPIYGAAQCSLWRRPSVCGAETPLRAQVAWRGRLRHEPRPVSGWARRKMGLWRHKNWRRLTSRRP